MTDMSLERPRPQTMQARNWGRLLANWWMAGAVLLLIVVLATLRPQLIDTNNVANILRSFSLMAIMILGLTWVVASGKIDVSFMQIAALSNMTTAYLLAMGSGWALAALCGILVGALAGLINGTLIALWRLPPLIVTIATGGICASIAAALGKGTSIRIADSGVLGQFLYMSWGPVPLIAIVVAVMFVVAWYAQERLAFGQYLYAMAQNEEAVVEAGISSSRLLMFLFVFSGVLSAIAGVLLAANLSSGQPMIGSSYFIDGLTAVLLGGIMVRIGKPNVIGTVTAILLLTVLVSGGALLGWPDYQRQIIKGLLLLFGVALAMRAKRSGTRNTVGA